MRKVDTLSIVHVVFSFDYGGLERRILRLIDGLEPRGARFTIVSLRASAGRFLGDRPNVRHVVLGARPGLDLRAVGRLASLLRSEQAHVVHSHNWVSMLEGIVAGRLARVPAVVHGEHGASRFEPDQLRWRRTQAQRGLARLAHRVVPVNEAIRDRVVDVWGIPADRCTVIRNGVDTNRFARSDRPTDGTVVVGSVSRLEPIKNFPCLVRAIHRLNAGSERARYRLVLVGEGGERPALERLVRELGAEDYVDLPGATDAPERCYPAFDVYVNCSFSEGMSNTVLEAMACGLPVVATDCAGHRDWLVAERNALFFTSDDDDALAKSIERLANDRALAGTMADRNRALVEADYGQQRFIENYAALYHELLDRAGLTWAS